jgi:hypothetical protein
LRRTCPSNRGAVFIAVALTFTNKNVAPISSKQTREKISLKLKSDHRKSYCSCYASSFRSKEKSLDEWVSCNANVYQKSKNVNISIDNLQYRWKKILLGQYFLNLTVLQYSKIRAKNIGAKKNKRQMENT